MSRCRRVAQGCREDGLSRDRRANVEKSPSILDNTGRKRRLGGHYPNNGLVDLFATKPTGSGLVLLNVMIATL